MTRSLYEFTGLSANTPKAELVSAVEERMKTAFSEAAAGDENAQKELAELRFSYLLWAYGSQEGSSIAFPASNDRRARIDAGVRRVGERRRRPRDEHETVADSLRRGGMAISCRSALSDPWQGASGEK